MISRWQTRELHTQNFCRSRLSSENTYQNSGRSRFQLLVLSSYLHASCVTIITVIYFTIFYSYELNKNCLLAAPKPERSRGMAIAPSPEPPRRPSLPRSSPSPCPARPLCHPPSPAAVLVRRLPSSASPPVPRWSRPAPVLVLCRPRLLHAR